MSFLNSLKSIFKGTSRVDISQRFEILREAISGTMSKFYVARDRTTDKVVGLKVLDKDKTLALEARFKGTEKPTEGEIASKFNHPLIVKTLEHGFTNKGEQYLVMEYLEGPGINSLIVSKSEQLNGRRVHFIRQAGEALAEVHRQGFIHRDVCPRNLVANKEVTDLKLIDFGLTVPAKPIFMQPGIRTGTPNYMAPEVVRRKPTSQLIDVFSFGVMAFEICTFELPWPRGAGLDAMKHGSLEPYEIRTFRPKIDERLARAIHACLASDPSKRLESIGKFLSLIKDIKHEDAA